MLSEVFYWLFSMSIAGGAACLAVLCLRKIKKLPKPAVFWFWIIPMLRFVLPFGVASRFGLMALVSKFATKTVVVYDGAQIAPDLTFANCITAADSYFPITYKTNLVETVFHTASIVWAAGAALAVLAAVVLYAAARREIKGAACGKDGICFSDRAASPALYGVFRPKIVVPSHMAGENLTYVALHEAAHAARRDNLWRCAAVFICCIHWFNPLCWISLKYFFEDMELACDSRAVKSLSKAQRREYARALIAAARGKNLFAAAFGGAKIKDRMENVLSYRRLTAASAAAFAALTIAIVLVFITNAPV